MKNDLGARQVDGPSRNEIEQTIAVGGGAAIGRSLVHAHHAEEGLIQDAVLILRSRNATEDIH